MLKNDTTSVYDLIALLNPADVIPVIEEGIETETLKLQLSNTEEARRRIQQSRILLALLYTHKLGIDQKQPG